MTVKLTNQQIMNSLVLNVNDDLSKKVIVAAEFNGQEVQALQIEIADGRLRVYNYAPGPDYASREAVLIVDIGARELLRSLEVTDDD